MLDFDAHEKEINLATDDIVQMIASLFVLEFDVEAVLDSNFHFDWFVYAGFDSWELDEDFVFLGDGWEPLALDFDADKVFYGDVATMV